jgi:hypothetical protein
VVSAIALAIVIAAYYLADEYPATEGWLLLRLSGSARRSCSLAGCAMSEQHAAAREAGAGEPTAGLDWKAIAALVADRAGRARTARIAPGSHDAARVLLKAST